MPTSFFASSVFVAGRELSLQRPPYLVAEIGINHDGKSEQGLRLIEEAAAAGADAVKFQSYSIANFINRSAQGVASLYDIFAQVELNLEQHQKFAARARELGMDFFSTPLTIDWVEKLKNMQVPALKVASGDVNNFQLLTELVRAQLPIFHSTGAASFAEIERAAAFYRQMNFSNVVFFHCISLYPAPLEKMNMETIFKMRSRLAALIGFSDHSKGSWAAFAAVIAGVVAVEKHFTFDRNLSGPDHKISADPQQFKDLREKIDLAFVIRGEAKESALDAETAADYYGKRSLYPVSDNDFMAMRPRQKSLPKDSDFFLVKK